MGWHQFCDCGVFVFQLPIPVNTIIDVVENRRNISVMYIQAMVALLNKTVSQCFVFPRFFTF